MEETPNETFFSLRHAWTVFEMLISRHLEKLASTRRAVAENVRRFRREVPLGDAQRRIFDSLMRVGGKLPALSAVSAIFAPLSKPATIYFASGVDVQKPLKYYRDALAGRGVVVTRLSHWYDDRVKTGNYDIYLTFIALDGPPAAPAASGGPPAPGGGPPAPGEEPRAAALAARRSMQIVPKIIIIASNSSMRANGRVIIRLRARLRPLDECERLCHFLPLDSGDKALERAATTRAGRNLVVIVSDCFLVPTQRILRRLGVAFSNHYSRHRSALRAAPRVSVFPLSRLEHAIEAVEDADCVFVDWRDVVIWNDMLHQICDVALRPESYRPGKQVFILGAVKCK